MSTIWKFKNRENKHDVCRGKGCIKKFCESLREHAMKEMKLLMKEQQESYEILKNLLQIGII